MSIYTMRNILNKFIKQEINILYLYPNEFEIPQAILQLDNEDHINLYHFINIPNLTWFSYDIILTHQINEQIINLSYQMHCPIVCYIHNNIDPNKEMLGVNNQNIKFIEKDNSLNEELLKVLSDTKHQRFIL